MLVVWYHSVGFGAISEDPVITLVSSSSLSDPQAFILTANTRGGPPTNYTWSRDGAEIRDDRIYSISIAVSGEERIDYQESRYTSTLTVIGRRAGMYEYSVTNRATSGTRTGSYTVQGIKAFKNCFKKIYSVLF